MKRVLITGCAGFVGPYVADVLKRAGYAIWGADQKDTTSAVPSGNYRSCDLADETSVKTLLSETRPDTIVHLAAQSSAGRSFDTPGETIKNNVLPITYVLEHVRRTGENTRVLSVGSADVYGPVKASELPLDETRSPNPANPYAMSKTIQEQICAQYASLYGVDVVMTRSFNHTGGGQRDTFVLSSFAKQISQIKLGMRKPVVEVGNVDVKRDFSDVRDVADAYLALLEKGKSGGIYNVCSGTSYSLRALLEKTAKLADVSIEIRVDESLVRPADMEELRGDNAKIARDTGWCPKVPIEDTLKSLLDFWANTLRT
ncbi:MAG: GDP-mannose 4,6-dehydratase [Candidatus Latescibacterota bacterium]|nr:MAG: GDP-mannose 4,6-dehydratase [Candidatus Latescibacterota bacterium]